MRGPLLIATGLVLVAVVGVAALVHTPDTGSRSGGAAPPGPGGAGGAADPARAQRFLTSYVERDGRVVRPDQGGDTVSEGQAYALLMALALDDEDRFEQVWTWTETHLQRQDGLFAWHWAGGAVVDDMPAADADLDIASALLVAADQFDRPRWAEAARRVAAAVMEHETVEVGGRLYLAAGPWAVRARVVNPSYLARCGYEELAERTGDDRWADIGADGLALLADLAERGLPPDWVVLSPDGGPRPIPAPGRPEGDQGRYGLDAARIPLRLAACRDGRDVAARLWDRLRDLDGGGRGLAYALDGDRLDGAEHPVGLLAAAAAARAAGDERPARDLTAEAGALHRRTPTYYGAAWLALADLLVATERGARPSLARVAAVGPARTPGAAPLAQAEPDQPTTTLDGATGPTTPPSTTTTTTASTTTAPPTTSAPTTSSTAPVTTATTAPDGSTSSSTATSAPSAGTGVGPGTTEPAATTPRGGTTGTASGTRSGATGDLSDPDAGNPLVAAAGDARSGDEPARRRTGLVVAGGLAASAALGAVLGLRDRSRALRGVRRPT